MNFFGAFNRWWTEYHQTHQRRPSKLDIEGWRSNNPNWRPELTLEDIVQHSKGRRDPQKNRQYFVEYRRKIKEAAEKDPTRKPARGRRGGAKGPGEDNDLGEDGGQPAAVAESEGVAQTAALPPVATTRQLRPRRSPASEEATDSEFSPPAAVTGVTETWPARANRLLPKGRAASASATSPACKGPAVNATPAVFEAPAHIVPAPPVCAAAALPPVPCLITVRRSRGPSLMALLRAAGGSCRAGAAPKPDAHQAVGGADLTSSTGVAQQADSATCAAAPSQPASKGAWPAAQQPPAPPHLPSQPAHDAPQAAEHGNEQPPSTAAALVAVAVNAVEPPPSCAVLASMHGGADYPHGQAPAHQAQQQWHQQQPSTAPEQQLQPQHVFCQQAHALAQPDQPQQQQQQQLQLEPLAVTQVRSSPFSSTLGHGAQAWWQSRSAYSCVPTDATQAAALMEQRRMLAPAVQPVLAVALGAALAEAEAAPAAAASTVRLLREGSATFSCGSSDVGAPAVGAPAWQVDRSAAEAATGCNSWPLGEEHLSRGASSPHALPGPCVSNGGGWVRHEAVWPISESLRAAGGRASEPYLPAEHPAAKRPRTGGDAAGAEVLCGGALRLLQQAQGQPWAVVVAEAEVAPPRAPAGAGQAVPAPPPLPPVPPDLPPLPPPSGPLFAAPSSAAQHAPLATAALEAGKCSQPWIHLQQPCPIAQEAWQDEACGVMGREDADNDAAWIECLLTDPAPRATQGGCCMGAL